MMNNLERLRQENPLVVCYTNDVVKNFTPMVYSVSARAQNE